MFVDSYKCKALLKDGSLNSKVKRKDKGLLYTKATLKCFLK